MQLECGHVKGKASLSYGNGDDAETGLGGSPERRTADHWLQVTS